MPPHPSPSLLKPMPRTTPRSLARSAIALALTLGLSACIHVRASTTRDPGQEPSAAAAAPGETIVRVEPVRARSPEEAAVLRTVVQLFDGMRAGDSSMVRAAFDSGARLVTIADRDGIGRVSHGSVDDFVRAVGTPHEAVWDERISHEVVTIDGPLATVWMRYRFYAGESFSHCGVNSFELVRRPGGWKITSIADTRRRDGCDTAGE